MSGARPCARSGGPVQGVDRGERVVVAQARHRGPARTRRGTGPAADPAPRTSATSAAASAASSSGPPARRRCARAPQRGRRRRPGRPAATCASTSVDAQGRREPAGRAGVVAGQQHRATIPSPRSPRTASAAARPDRVGHLEHGPRDAVPRHRDGRRPGRLDLRRRRRPAPAGRSIPCSASRATRPTSAAWAITRGSSSGSGAQLGDDRRAPRARGSRRTPRRRAARRTALARRRRTHRADGWLPAGPAGCPARRGGDGPGDAQRLVGVDARGDVHACSCRTPVVTVPVRHSTTVSTRAARSSVRGPSGRAPQRGGPRGRGDQRGRRRRADAARAGDEQHGGRGAEGRGRPAPAPSQNPSVATARAATTRANTAGRPVRDPLQRDRDRAAPAPRPRRPDDVVAVRRRRSTPPSARRRRGCARSARPASRSVVAAAAATAGNRSGPAGCTRPAAASVTSERRRRAGRPRSRAAPQRGPRRAVQRPRRPRRRPRGQGGAAHGPDRAGPTTTRTSAASVRAAHAAVRPAAARGSGAGGGRRDRRGHVAGATARSRPVHRAGHRRDSFSLVRSTRWAR